jgi:H+-translocating NAD(P) transhydrogenase subunit alpha
MASDTATVNQTLLDRAQAAADAARHAADQAQSYADQIAHTGAGPAADVGGVIAHAATGGIVDPFVFRIAILALACFVGYYVVWSVTPALHTPLMSVTNAISSVIIVGALLAVGVDASGFSNDGPIWARIFGFFAVILASVNIFGGFLVTERMLSMYKKKG